MGPVGAMEISPLSVGAARQASVAIVVAKERPRGRSHSSFRGLSVDCAVDGVGERWKRGALSRANVRGGGKRVIVTKVHWVMRS